MRLHFTNLMSSDLQKCCKYHPARINPSAIDEVLNLHPAPSCTIWYGGAQVDFFSACIHNYREFWSQTNAEEKCAVVHHHWGWFTVTLWRITDSASDYGFLFFSPKGQTEQWTVWPWHWVVLLWLQEPLCADLGSSTDRKDGMPIRTTFSRCLHALRATRRQSMVADVEVYATAIGALVATFVL